MMIKVITAFCLCTSLLTGCKGEKPPLRPLSSSEMNELSQLHKKYQQEEKLVNQYKQEKKRIELIEKNYAKEYVDLSGVKIIKSSSFSDGLTRACRIGKIKNNGSEIINEIKIKFVFRSDSDGSIIKEWDNYLINSNDEFINNQNADAQARVLVQALSGTINPIRPNSIYELPNKNACFEDSFMGWSASNVEMVLSHVKLRPKMTEHNSLKLLEIGMKIGELEQRARENNQIK